MSRNVTTATLPRTPRADAIVGQLSPLPDGWTSLAQAFVRQARASGNRPALSDSTGVHLNYSDTLIRSIACARLLKRLLGPEPYVGLLLPPLVPSAVANIALTMLGKIPVNLNYTAGPDAIQAAIDECGIQHILTSRKVLARFHLEPKGKLLFLEDLRDQVTLRDKIEAAVLGRWVPQAALGAWFPGLRGDQLDQTATVIFTSGSTGDPKGVVLTHRNILSNIHQISSHIDLLPDESVLGILPFFHAFGFTVGIWTVLCLGKKVVYHHNPVEARVIGDLCDEHKVTMLVGTPTYMRMYLQRCKPAQFATLVHLLLGAEKLKPELARHPGDARNRRSRRLRLHRALAGGGRERAAGACAPGGSSDSRAPAGDGRVPTARDSREGRRSPDRR